MTNKVICILGMHRSGTSAVTGVLGLLGVELSEPLLGPAPGESDKGFWEHRDILHVHERLLASLGSSWDDVCPLPDSWWTDQRVLTFRAEIVRILHRNFGNTPVWGVKDPRLCRIMPLWLDILDEMGCQCCFVLTNRHPIEVVQSLRTRNGFAGAKSALLWLDHNLSAEKWTRGRPRAFISYEQLLDDPRETIEKIARETGCRFPKRMEDAIDDVQEFLTPQLRHHVGAGKDWVNSIGNCGPLVAATYETLTAACQGETGEVSAVFDRLQQEYDALVSSFEPAITSHVADLQARVRKLEERLDRSHASASWRLNRPLRRVGRLLRRVLAGPTAK